MLSQPQEVNLLVKHRGWILEAIVRESASEIKEDIRVNLITSTKREKFNPINWITLLPRFNSEKRLFIHHQVLKHVDIPTLTKSTRNRLLLTHFDPDNLVPLEVKNTITLWNRILVQNSRTKDLLMNSVPKIEERQVVVYFGAVNRDLYFPCNLKRNKSYILVVGDCKPRKNPQLLSQVIKSCPEIYFVIHGKHWENFLDIKNKEEYPNVEYLPFDKARNAALVREASLLLSLSQIEGGPIPILEALASGVRVICTDTGFARDIVGAKQGVVLANEISVKEIVEILRDEFAQEPDNKQDLLLGKLTWKEMAEKLYK